MGCWDSLGVLHFKELIRLGQNFTEVGKNREELLDRERGVLTVRVWDSGPSRSGVVLLDQHDSPLTSICLRLSSDSTRSSLEVRFDSDRRDALPVHA